MSVVGNPVIVKIAEIGTVDIVEDVLDELEVSEYDVLTPYPEFVRRLDVIG